MNIYYAIEYKFHGKKWEEMYSYTNKNDAIEGLRDLLSLSTREWYDGYPMTPETTRISRKITFNIGKVTFNWNK